MRTHRPEKIASVIQRIASEMIAEKLQDPRISRFTSITRVEVSGDLQLAKVYVSVMGEPADQRTTLRGLQRAKGLVQRAIARELSLRHCPEIRFVEDPSLKRAAEILRLIEQSMPPSDGPEPAEAPDSAPDDEEDGATS
jgi:ribosome-binding factor A